MTVQYEMRGTLQSQTPRPITFRSARVGRAPDTIGIGARAKLLPSRVPIMRTLLTALGAVAVIVYAVLGALLMTRWELTAASGLPFADTVAAMDAAGQPYSAVSGVAFAVVGIVLALIWATWTLAPAIRPRRWPAVAVWGMLLAFGAPAYFFASFMNMNSIGDTFYDWNADAAFRTVAPLYLVSAAGAVLTVIAIAFSIGEHRTRATPPPSTLTTTGAAPN